MLFVRGPVFANIILADEINRTPAKDPGPRCSRQCRTSITAAGLRHALEEPFYVLATQKSRFEMEGNLTRCPKRNWIGSCSMS